MDRELYDMLDRIGSDNKYCNVYMNIDDERIPKVICDGGFYDDIFKLNLLAQRLEQMSPAYTAGFKAVLMAHENYNLDDLILVTYGLEAYPIYPCRDHAELGKVVIDNDMIPEVENCPDELAEYLDIDITAHNITNNDYKIGSLLADGVPRKGRQILGKLTVKF